MVSQFGLQAKYQRCSEEGCGAPDCLLVCATGDAGFVHTNSRSVLGHSRPLWSRRCAGEQVARGRGGWVGGGRVGTMWRQPAAPAECELQRA